MAAGITVYHDRSGGMAADLVQNQWPTRDGEPRPKEYSTTAYKIGTGVHCNAQQCYRPPSVAAGTSKRMGAFFEKTGVMQHRTEPGFRDLKGMATLTEVPMRGYGTLKQSSARMANAASLVLHVGRDDDAASQRSRSSAAGSAAGSRRSGQSRRSASAASSVRSETPSWARHQPPPPPYNFDCLPMYDRTNASYGKRAHELYQSRAAGKSESGFMDPGELVAALTRHPP